MSAPEWFAPLLGLERLPDDGSVFEGVGKRYVVDGAVVRAEALFSDQQTQTAETFGYKWHQVDAFESDAALARVHEWLIERYGDVASAGWWSEYGERPVLLDAGC